MAAIATIATEAGQASDVLESSHVLASSRATRRALLPGLSMVGAVLVLALLAPALAPHDPAEQFAAGLTPAGEPVGPGGDHPLGTDRLGRDLLSRTLFGARNTLLVALPATALATLIGVLVGASAATLGDRRIGLPSPGGRRLEVPLPVETILLRITDVALAFPVLLLAILLVAVVGQSLALIAVVIASVAWGNTARVVYARAVGLRRAAFVEAARSMGAGELWVLAKHVVPHLAPVVLALSVVTLSGVVLLEASLSYLGVGIPRPEPSWGSMLQENISYATTQPRLLLVPGAAIALTILGFGLLGDGLTDLTASGPRRWRNMR